MEKKIKELLAIFDTMGIASIERFRDVLTEHHPRTLLESVQSVIVYAEGTSSEDPENMGEFSDYFGALAAQTDVLEYLEAMGHDTYIMGSNDDHVSLVKMGIESGIGELSPVDSVVIKELGLTASLGAILTSATLTPDDKAVGVCISCMKCLRVCPIRDMPNAKGDLIKCGCGKCKHTCPV